MPRIVMTVVALAIGCVAGMLTGWNTVDALRAYKATHKQIIVQVVEEGSVVAEVTWKDAAGTQHRARVRAPLDHLSTVQARIWIDGEGRPAPRPLGPAEIVLTSLLAGVVIGGVIRLALWRAWLFRCRWLVRKAAAKGAETAAKPR
ncbi:hypothetical protein HII36_37740 [Nonomuraea sp. NN258]|uniref:hypothetical protein n=1 Tax=Nonomuraea antri TaxID=2730852 RepID=UPI00156980CD|nr:hypothetical protein [Nonomuraea antri]NRQ37534.1 hypothetical protein [Nonomuraea antri]